MCKAVADRNLLSLLQTRPGLQASAERLSGRHRDPGLLCTDRLHADPALDGVQADLADLRDAVLVLFGLGERTGSPGPPGKTQKKGHGVTRSFSPRCPRWAILRADRRSSVCTPHSLLPQPSFNALPRGLCCALSVHSKLRAELDWGRGSFRRRAASHFDGQA